MHATPLIRTVGHRCAKLALLLTLGLLALGSTGCSRMRFIVDLVPPDDTLGEEAVLGDHRSRTKVAMVELNGMLTESAPELPFMPAQSPVEKLDEALAKAARDDDVRAVILRVNSRGGTVTASDIMYRSVQRFRSETGKPVVTLFTEVGASGAYYLACAGDEIHAYPTAITGSIGVIYQTFNISEGMHRYGIHAQTVASGPNKALGSMFEPPVAEHRAILQEMVDTMYARFRGIVADARPSISEADFDRLTDGRVVTGEDAARVGLIDHAGDLHDAFDAAQRLAGIDHAVLMRYRRGPDQKEAATWYAQAPAAASGPAPLLRLEVSGQRLPEPGFHFLWMP